MVKCEFCPQTDESQLTICTRIVKGKVEHIDICLACWPIERASRRCLLENEHRRKILSMQRKESAGAILDEERNNTLSKLRAKFKLYN